tara:strand:- start:826 stop:963 length:138 start_codon:yes stop_codon:yes gene_type:complete
MTNDGKGSRERWLTLGVALVLAVAAPVWLIVTLYAYPNAKGRGKR